jgi:UDP-N-acetylmuramoyl-tripeptide--D-alanyl-D-alanine ligase
MLELGNRSEQFHDHIGEKALECGVSLMFTFGEHSEAAVRRFRQGGGEGTHFSDMQLLIDQLRSRLSEGDLILVKGSRAGRLDRVVEALKA